MAIFSQMAKIVRKDFDRQKFPAETLTAQTGSIIFFPFWPAFYLHLAVQNNFVILKSPNPDLDTKRFLGIKIVTLELFLQLAVYLMALAVYSKWLSAYRYI